MEKLIYEEVRMCIFISLFTTNFNFQVLTINTIADSSF